MFFTRASQRPFLQLSFVISRWLKLKLNAKAF